MAKSTIRRDKRKAKRQVLKVQKPLGGLLAWKKGSNGEGYSFEPLSSERVIYYNNEIHETCPICGLAADGHWGLRETEEGFYITKCPPEPLLGNHTNGLFVWDRKNQNYAGDTEVDGVWQGVVYGGVSRDKLYAANQAWRERQPWYNNDDPEPK